MKVKARRPFHILLRDGVLEDIGKGDYILQPGQKAMEFETQRDRALHPLVADKELSEALIKMKREVDTMKSAHAYAGKEYDARKLASFCVGGELPANFIYYGSDFPHLDLEVKAQSCTPLEAATAILNAVSRSDSEDMGTLALEEQRIAKRETIKTIESDLNND